MQKATPEYNPLKPYVFLLLTVLFWSGNFVLGRGIRDLIPPVALNFWRWTGALLILLPFGLPGVRRQKELIVRHWKYLVLMSIPSIVAFNTFIYTALQSTTTTNTVLVNATTPVFIAVAAWAFFRDLLRPRQIAGVAISLAGLVYIVARGDFAMLKSLDFSGGDLWTIGAAVSWAIYSVMLRKRPSQLNLIVFLTVIVFFGLIVSLPFYLWELWEKGGFKLEPASYASIAYVCIFPSVLSYLFWNRAILMVGPNRAGIFIHLMPVFSILLASVFLGETLRFFHLAGMALIFTGIALTTLPGFRR